ncbi:hypothetical protein BH09MYX1_BH09MYX1_50030 [soil metagenome]
MKLRPFPLVVFSVAAVAGGGWLLGACSATGDSNASDACAFGGEGCPCADVGATDACGDLVERHEDYATCAIGKRTCGSDKHWSACAHTGTAHQSLGPITASGAHTMGLGTPAPCQNNPCNPACVNIVDDGSGITPGADSGLAITDAGITLGAFDGATPSDAGACKNLQCQVAKCDAGSTTITGTVYDPAGKNPLYGATVFVPNEPLPVFTNGVSADQCGSNTAVAVTTTTTGPDGKFTLTGVPSGANVPLVIQIGRWRRQVTLPTITSCTTTAVAAALTHLPAKKAEGDMPEIAIATGSADPFECLLVKMGIDKTEFGNGTDLTSDYGTAPRVHVYQDNGAKVSLTTPAATSLYSSLPRWKDYNLVMLPCEGYEDDKPNAYDQNLVDYTGVGGRVFATHFGYSWMRSGVAPFKTIVNWQDPNNQYNITDPVTGYVDSSFPKGLAFQQWLVNVGASATAGKLTINESRWNVLSTTSNAQQWIYGWSTNKVKNAPDTVQQFTFNTPVGQPPANQVGRVAYTNYHVSAAAVCDSSKNFPDRCCTGNLSAQEKALEFLFMDVSSCVQPDVPPPPPIPPYQKPAVFTRDYEGVCPVQQRPRWHFFDFQTVTPDDSSLVFAAATADTQLTLPAATSVKIATVTGAPITSWTGVDVEPKLPNASSKHWLRITMTLNPSTNGYSAPTVSAWRQLYDCVDAL